MSENTPSDRGGQDLRLTLRFTLARWAVMIVALVAVVMLATQCSAPRDNSADPPAAAPTAAPTPTLHPDVI